jgi:hypothetical protein
VGLTDCVMEAFGKNPAVLHNHGADGGIGSCQAKRPRSFPERKPHEAFVGFWFGL